MGETVLVTGATGFIGTALASRLEEEGATVLRMSLSLGHDVACSAAFEPFLERQVHTVYHLAARTFVPASWDDPTGFYRVNTIGTQHALEFCRSVGARLLYLSTYVYGTPKYLPVDEDHPVRPTNPYAHSKWLAEQMCVYYMLTWQVPVAIVRAFNVYGPGQSELFIVPSIVRQWVRGHVVRVENLAPKRDLVYLKDFVDACIAISSRNFNGQVFNIGSGISTSVRDLVSTLEQVVGEKVPFEETGPHRKEEIPEVVASSRLVRERLWFPRTSLEEGLAQVVSWEKGNSPS